MKNRTGSIALSKKKVKIVKKKIPSSRKPSLSRNSEKTDIHKLGVENCATVRKKMVNLLNSKDSEKYKAILENIQVGYFETDIYGNIISLSDSVCRALGYSQEEMMKMNVRQLSNRETLKKVFQVTNEVYKTGKPFKDFSWQAIGKDGAERYVKGSISLKKNSSGTPTGFWTIASDITEHKQTQDALGISEEKYKNILENIQEGYFEVDLAGNLTFFNDSLSPILGYSKEELMGMNYRQYTDADNAKKLFQSFNEVYKTEKPSKAFDWQIRRKDGTNSYIETSFMLRRDSAGKAIGFKGIVRDITERKLAEKKMCENEKLYRAIFENTGTATLIISGDNIITLANTEFERLSGFKKEEVENKKQWMDFIAKDDLDRMMTQHLTRMKNPDDALRNYEFRFITRTGETRNILLFLDMIKSTKQTVCSLLDITERKRTEEKYRNIFENVQEGIYQTTPEGRFITANQSMARILGYNSPEDLISSVTDISGQLYLDSEERKSFIEMVEKQGVVRNSDVQQRRKDGSIIWVSRTIQAVRDDKGKTLYYEGLIMDITERKANVERLRNALDNTVRAIASMVESRDPYTAGHQQHVGNLAHAIATEMGLSSDQIEGLHMAAIIHDIGKISVPAEILSKPAKLTDIEFRLIKSHSQLGYDILKDIEFPWPVARMVLEHHERMNGSGYPRNLRGDEILMESRILALADVLEAMASHRPYRPTLGIKAALEEIEKNKGILYDSAVANACLRLFREKGYQLT